MTSGKLRLFAGYGIEIEYMIVDRVTLEVMPIADRLLRELSAGDDWVNDVEWSDDTGISNELVLHLVELKNVRPIPDWTAIADGFARRVAALNETLRGFGCKLMPTAMHPWMQPKTDTRLWPHDYAEVYETYHRIFDCHRHGWANVQSTHINLPFGDDEEFGRLHAAIRMVLPLIPSLAAASPFKEGRHDGALDARLEVYATNSQKVRAITAGVIPEPIFDVKGYHEGVFANLYREIEAHDPGGILRHEWLNARGAIARFDRDAIEIRLVDSQECPRADIAVSAAVVAAVRAMVEERFCDLDEQKSWQQAPLRAIFDVTIRDAEEAVIDDPAFRRAWGWTREGACPAREIWSKLVDELMPAGREKDDARLILDHGTLSRRILRRLDGKHDRAHLKSVYGELCDHLARGTFFGVGDA